MKSHTNDEVNAKMLEAERLLRRRIEIGKARFGRRMKMPNKGTENKKGHPYGDTNGYYPWEDFPPGGGNK